LGHPDGGFAAFKERQDQCNKVKSRTGVSSKHLLAGVQQAFCNL